MKIGIISDTHGDMRSIEKAIPYLEKCDLIIHAGDYIDDAEYIHYATDVEVKCVKGNSDLYRFDGDYELTFSVKIKSSLYVMVIIMMLKWVLTHYINLQREKIWMWLYLAILIFQHIKQ